MKTQYYIPLLILTISCGQGAKEKKEEPAVTKQNVAEAIEAAAELESKSESADFDKAITASKSKELPLIETTNFDSFIDEDDYKDVPVEALKLDQIYPDFKNENYDFRAIAYYQLPLSDDFYTLVITLLKGEHEMESILINYDSDGNIIAHEKVSFDEIAEGMSQVVSRISENKLTVNRIFWGNTKQVEQIEFEILMDGKIEKVDTKRLDETIKNYTLVNSILEDLKMDWVQTKTSLIAIKESPENPNETIVAIPEIVDEKNQYFNLNSHIVIADNRTGKITQNYFESHQTNEWESDAIQLDGIEIDTSIYKVTETQAAFGLRVSRFGSSRVNPYSNKTLSLFLKSGDSLLKVLSGYPIENYGGEWDGDCDGEFIGTTKTLVTSTEETNGHFDILVYKKITNTKSFEDKNVECQTENTVNLNNAILKFDGQNYIETKANTISYYEFNPKKLQQIDIENFSMDNAYQLGEFKIIAGNGELTGKEADLSYAKKDWGDRLLMLDTSNNIVYKSQGVGDVYLFEPHFYKSDASDKIIIICQMAFEYPFGGEAFILENGKLNYIGTLDIEGYDPEQDGSMYMSEIVEIKEGRTGIEFAFKADKLVLSPGSEDEVVMNNNLRYVYQNNKLSLLSNNP